MPHNNKRESSSHLGQNLLHANMGFTSHFYKHACEFASHFFGCFTVVFTAVVDVLHSWFHAECGDASQFPWCWLHKYKIALINNL